MYQVCPVCNGRGTVPKGFYDGAETGTGSTAANMREPCRACGGSGVLYSFEGGAPIVWPVMPPAPPTVPWPWYQNPVITCLTPGTNLKTT